MDSLHEIEPSFSRFTPETESRYFAEEYRRQHFPFNPSSQFEPTGSLLGEYGDYAILPHYAVTVSSVPNLLERVDFSDLVYKVEWDRRRRRLIGGAITRSWYLELLGAASTGTWYLESRGENYTEKRIAAKALFHTYFGLLDDQAEAKQMWEDREKVALTYTRNRTKDQERIDFFTTMRFKRFRSAGFPHTDKTVHTVEYKPSPYNPGQDVPQGEPTNEQLGMPSLGIDFQQPPSPAS